MAGQGGFNNKSVQGDSISIAGIQIDAVCTVQGPIVIPILGLSLRASPGPGERVGIGSMGFRITMGDMSVLNLGDSILLPEWKHVSADVLMLPIGGLGQATWTMDVDEAIEAVKLIEPGRVIPCHYSVPLFWKRKFAVADDQRFKREVERLGIECTIQKYGEAVTI